MTGTAGRRATEKKGAAADTATPRPSRAVVVGREPRPRRLPAAADAALSPQADTPLWSYTGHEGLW